MQGAQAQEYRAEEVNHRKLLKLPWPLLHLFQTALCAWPYRSVSHHHLPHRKYRYRLTIVNLSICACVYKRAKPSEGYQMRIEFDTIV